MTDKKSYFRLRELREKKKLSQVRLAIDLNVNQNTISRYEKGEREADYSMLIAIADYFNVSVDYLLGRTDNPKINR
ncbi:MAG: helix-turn-helix domain-containing protein [Clostridia bacterium]|nr:helix-turn-helix domain-containing protein [Clostridia bacterium]